MTIDLMLKQAAKCNFELETEQEIFDYVCMHLAKQQRRAGVVEDGVFRCKYKTEEGLMCAAGCLLTEEELQLTAEGVSIDHQELPLRLHTHTDLLKSLQDAHDKADSPAASDMQGRLRTVARCYALNEEAIEQITEWRG